MAQSATLSAHRRHEQIRWASGLDALAGIWLLCSAFFIPEAENAFWNFLIVGVLVTAMALARAGGAYRQTWLSWGNVLLGAWLIISPWVIAYAAEGASMWNAIVTGIVIVALAGWSASIRGDERRPERH